MTDIVYITVDSLRADHVGWHGYERDTTPFLDSLSESAHTFTNAFSHGCYTRQAFPAMMAAEYPSISQSHGGLSEEYTPLAEALSEAGYTTGGFHSNPHLLPQFGYHRGFDRFYDSDTESSKLARLRQWVKDTIPSQSFLYSTLEAVFSKTEEAGFNPGTPFVLADEITDLAIDWCQSVATESQRFLWVHYMDVHHPYSPPEEYQLAFREEAISERRAVKLRRKMVDQPEEVTDAELSDIVDLYDGEIRFVDDQVRRLVETVQSQWGADTLIAFTSDHGDELNDHDDFAHRDTLFDELAHVPLLIQCGEQQGVHEDMVGLMDLPPTFLECAGIEPPSTFRGESLVKIMEGGSTDQDYVLIDEGETIAYRDRSWKYIVGPGRVELYNIQNDPGEQINVVDQHPEVVEEIEATLEQYSELGTADSDELTAGEFSGEVQDRLEQLGYLQE
ncbi:sulfatase [Halovenus salina]|uniref:sulfatase n=1 Tax=Halovenus salina TaxID=1510225 RepID=UPI002260B80D|nr:sulfatase [Halovenus salina]